MGEKRIHHGYVFVVLSVGALTYGVLSTLLLPALLTVSHSLHTSLGSADWLLVGLLLSAAVLTPILGRLGDVFGKKKMIVVVLGVTSLGLLISGLATSILVMIIGRVIQGAIGAMLPLAFSVIRDEFPREKVTSGIGIVSGFLGAGSGIGLVVAGPIIHLSYHWLYWIPFILVLATTLAVIVVVPESRERAPAGINWTGALFMSGWLVTLLLAVSEGPTWGWRDSTVIALFVATPVLIVLWIRSEIRSSHPLVDMRMMRIPAVWTTNLAALLMGFGMFAMFVIVPEFVQTPSRDGYGFGSSLTSSGVFLVPITAAMLVLSTFSGRLTERFGSKFLLCFGAVFATGSYVFLLFSHDHAWSIYVASGLLGIGVGLGYSAMANLIVGAVSSDVTGIATGMNANARIIGAALGGGVVTSMIASNIMANGVPRESGYTVAFVACAAVLLISLGAAIAVPSRRRARGAVTVAVTERSDDAVVVVGAVRVVGDG